MEEGVVSQEMPVGSKNWKGKKAEPLLEPPEGTQSR